MPRNGSGNFSVTTTFVANTPALAADMNTVLGDIGDEITNSVAKDGQTPMTGALKLADGSASAPAATFSSDTNTGIYRKGADSIGIAAGGAEIASITTAGLVMASGKTIAATGGFTSGGVVKPGTIEVWGGPITNLPSDRLLCDGSAVSRTTYAALFAAISTMHGAGDGSTTFNLPDLRDKFVIGARQDDSSVAKTNVTGSLTQSGGSKDAVNVSHTHTATVTDPGHAHTYGQETDTDIAGGGVREGVIYSAVPNDRTSATNSNTTGITVSNSTEGSSGTNANLPPYYAFAYMIKT